MPDASDKEKLRPPLDGPEQEQARIVRLIRPAKMFVDGRLTGPTMRVEDLMDLKEDDVVTFDYPVERPLDLSINGKIKFRGGIVTTGRKRAFEIDQTFKAG